MKIGPRSWPLAFAEPHAGTQRCGTPTPGKTCGTFTQGRTCGTLTQGTACTSAQGEDTADIGAGDHMPHMHTGEELRGGGATVFSLCCRTVEQAEA